MGKKSLSKRNDLVKVSLDPKNDMTGRTFGEWFVVEYAGSRHGPWFKCRCSCGFIGILKGLELRRGSMSCGHNGSTYKHGSDRRNSRSKEYSIWLGMRDRCNNPNNRAYPDYGGRGIQVCARWNDYDLFFQDMGKMPSPKHSIDRFPNNDGNYEPENCRWATTAEQRRNGSKIISLTHKGVTMCLKDWCTKLQLKYTTIHRRVYRGMSPEKAVFGKEVKPKP
jgi:hypothetical protein